MSPLPTGGNPYRPSGSSISDTTDGPISFTARYPWAVFIVPFAVFMVLNSLEPTPEKGLSLFGWTVPYSSYPLIYTLKIVAVMAAMALVWRGYRQFPFKVSWLALGVGVAGMCVWVSLCKLELETAVLGLMGLEWLLGVGQRSGFNPFEFWPDQPGPAWAFFAVRMWGLGVIVPVIEEFFLRGFVMRYFVHPDWSAVPFGTVTTAALVAGTVTPLLLHPAEMVAALVWSSMVTWLMWRTRNIWDCVAAHMVTNLLLGCYVLASGDWYFL